MSQQLELIPRRRVLLEGDPAPQADQGPKAPVKGVDPFIGRVPALVLLRHREVGEAMKDVNEGWLSMIDEPPVRSGFYSIGWKAHTGLYVNVAWFDLPSNTWQSVHGQVLLGDHYISKGYVYRGVSEEIGRARRTLLEA